MLLRTRPGFQPFHLRRTLGVRVLRTHRGLGQLSRRLAVGIIQFTTDATCESACRLQESDALTSSERKCDLGVATRRLCGKSGDGDSEQPCRPDTCLDLNAALRI